MSDKTGGKSERFQTAVTVLIALVSTIIALVAARAAVVSGNSTEAQHDGVLAKINQERVDGGSRTDIARNKRALAAYSFNRRLYFLTFDYVTQAEQAGDAAKGTQLRLEAAGQIEESNLAYQFIDASYLVADENGDYTGFDEDTYLNDQRQNASIYEDIDYLDDFAAADAGREHGLALNISLFGWFVALMFLTWAEITKSALRWVWLAAGSLLTLGVLASYLLSTMAGMLGLS